MSKIAGVAVAGLSVWATWVIAGYVTRNLPASTGRVSLGLLLVLAAGVGFLLGSVIGRRARRNRTDLALFSGVAGAVAGGVLGSGLAFTVTLAYLSSYTTWPDDRMDQILLLLSYPVFTAVGLCAGAMVGTLVGLLLGGVVRATIAAR